jgi:UPF0755 protein
VRKLLIALVVILVLLLAGATAGLLTYRRVTQPYRGYSGAEQIVDIPQGAGSLGIGERLVAGGVVRDLTTFEVIDKIARGDIHVVNVTFPEGLTVLEMAKIFESNGIGPASSFVTAARNAALVRQLDPAATDLEGYLFPETYAVSRHADAATLVQLMVARFERVFTPELRQAAAARGLSIRQAVTLASIVEKETGRSEERPVVAAVYSNRLRKNMALQCDPTVIYALQKAGRYSGNLHRDDLGFNSPYNTYRYPGLPPGPIASPGRASLDAAVRPADNDFLYFVSRNDGSHEFARTLDEHNRNVHKFQVQFFREKRATEAGTTGRRR